MTKLRTSSKTDQADRTTENWPSRRPADSTGRRKLPTPGTKTSPTPIRSGASSWAWSGPPQEPPDRAAARAFLLQQINSHGDQCAW